MSNSKILFMMSGSIAAFKACQVISKLVQAGHQVQVAATASTFNFVGAATLEGLTGRKVLSDIWENGHAMEHIHLTRWADIALLCPASAHTIARLANGLADDLVSAMALAWPSNKPVWVFPAMNHQMLAAAATRENLAKLRARGFLIGPTESGSLACGEEGEGRLLEPDQIIKLLKRETRGRIMVTAGATREPIDGIRFISNVSTGQTAADLTDALAGLGWQVTYMHGAGAKLPSRAERIQSFGDFKNLEETLRAALSEHPYDAIIHCAAVSDYSVENPSLGIKLNSQGELDLKLKPNHKILPRLKEYSANKNLRVIGFKLTLNASEKETLAVARGLLNTNVDAVVANDWAGVQKDRSDQRHPGVLVSTGAERRFERLPELAAMVDELIGRNT